MKLGSYFGTSEDRKINRHVFPLDEWRLIETQYQTENAGSLESLFAVGNGYLGMRGNQDEGREGYSHGTYINGFHETWPINHAEEAYGFAKVGQTIINAPDSKIIRLYVDDEPLLIDESDFHSYDRVLDFRTGVLTREILWQTPGGKRVKVTSKRMVSFTEKHVGLITFEVEMLDEDAAIVLSSQILNRQDGDDEYDLPAAFDNEFVNSFDPRIANQFQHRVLEPRRQFQNEERSVLSYRAANSKLAVAVGAHHELTTDNIVQTYQEITDDSAKHVYYVDAKVGQPIQLTKLVTYHTAHEVPAKELVDRCRRTLDRCITLGPTELLNRQHEWLIDYWDSCDTVIEGQPELQQAIRWNLFQLAQASARAEKNGIAAKGVTASGYGGHYFWDTEIYVMPFLAYTQPSWARNALMFRYNMLPAARRRATELNQRGALFPWRTINGEEASAYYAAGTAQYHINADISFALAKYVRASGDYDFLYRRGVDILVETATMWIDLGFWRTNGDAQFHIHGVTGPDEYTTVVSDNLFTNAMAQFNLRYAAKVIRRMQQDDPQAYDQMLARLDFNPADIDTWEAAAEAMHLPYDEHLEIHPQDSHFLDRDIWNLAETPSEQRPLLLNFHPLVIYRFQVLKQPDVVMALFLQGQSFTPEQKLNNFKYYDPITTGDSSLSAVVQSIIAAEVGYSDLAVHYFKDAVFTDLADLHRNSADGVHIASTGGVWECLVYGFGGFRDYYGEFSFDPRLPAGWKGVSFKLRIGRAHWKVEIKQDRLTITQRGGGPIAFSVRDKQYVSDVDGSVRVPLDNQGPVIPGAPHMDDMKGMRREDGSLMASTVPEQN